MSMGFLLSKYYKRRSIDPFTFFRFSPPEEIDVIGDTIPSKRPYDPDKARRAMEECQRHVNFANPDVVRLADDEDWEDKVSK